MISIKIVKSVVLIITSIMIFSSVMAGDGLPEGQKIFFEVYHKNFAWGFQFSGYFIDSNGYIYNYKIDSPDKLGSLDKAYTEIDLMARYGQSPRLFAKIETTELAEKASLLNKVAEGRLLSPIGACNDFGEVVFIAYIYDSAAETYNPIVLYRAGDSVQKNILPEANKLAAWLSSIFYGISKNGCGYPE